MEAADCTAGYGYEQAREYRLPCQSNFRPLVGQPVPEFRNGRPFHEQANHEGYGHEYERNCEQRVDLADDLVDRKHRGDHIIEEYQDHPREDGQGSSAPEYAAEDDRRTVHENSADEDQEQEGKYEHDVLRDIAEVASDQDRQSASVIPERQHSGKVVVDGTGEDAPENDPQVCRRAELGSHDGPEDRTRTRDVEELDHEYSPGRHRDVIDSVRMGDRRGGAVLVRPENSFNDFSVEEVPYQKGQKADDKGNHFLSISSNHTNLSK